MRNRGNKDYEYLTYKGKKHGAYGAIIDAKGNNIHSSKYTICIATWDSNWNEYKCVKSKKLIKYNDNTFLEPRILKNDMVQITIEFSDSVSDAQINTYKISLDHDGDIGKHHRGNKSYAISQ